MTIPRSEKFAEVFYRLYIAMFSYVMKNARVDSWAPTRYCRANEVLRRSIRARKPRSIKKLIWVGRLSRMAHRARVPGRYGYAKLDFNESIFSSTTSSPFIFSIFIERQIRDIVIFIPISRLCVLIDLLKEIVFALPIYILFYERTEEYGKWKRFEDIACQYVKKIF